MPIRSCAISIGLTKRGAGRAHDPCLRELLASGLAVPYAPPALDREVRDQFPRLSTDHGIPVDGLEGSWSDYKSVIKFVSPRGALAKSLRPIARKDYEDLPYAQLALQIGAAGIVTSDRHFQGAGVVRSYISEPDRGRRNWKKKPAARAAVYRNRRRIRGPRGLRLLRLRGERLERPFAHLYETGRMRRVYLRGHTNILKRLLIHVGGFNLGLLMRQLIGVGTPRGLQGRLNAVLATLLTLIRMLSEPPARHWCPDQRFSLPECG